MEPSAKIRHIKSEFNPEKLEVVESEIGELRNCIPLCANVDIESDLIELASKVKAVPGAKRLAYEIENLAKTVFMPPELREQMNAKFDVPSIVNLSLVGLFQNHLRSFFVNVLYQVLNEATWAVQQIESNWNKSLCLVDIIRPFIFLDLDEALKLIDLLKGCDDKNGRFLSASLVDIAKVNPLLALKMTRDREVSFNQGLCRIYHQIVCTAALSDIEMAKDIAYHPPGNISTCELRALISKTIYSANPALAREILKNNIRWALAIGQEWELFDICLIVASIPELGLEVADHIKDITKRDRSYAFIAKALATNDPQRAVEIAKRIQSVPDRYFALAVLSSVIVGIDLEIAKTLSQEIIRYVDTLNDQKSKDFLLQYVVPCIAMTDLDQALGIAKQLNVALDNICEALAPVSPEKAYEIWKQGQCSPSALLFVMRGFLNRDLSMTLTLLEITKREKMYEVSKNLRKLYVDFIAIQAKADLNIALNFIEGIENFGLKASMLMQAALSVPSDRAKELVTEALRLMRQEKDPKKRAEYYADILTTLQNFIEE